MSEVFLSIDKFFPLPVTFWLISTLSLSFTRSDGWKLLLSTWAPDEAWRVTWLAIRNTSCNTDLSCCVVCGTVPRAGAPEQLRRQANEVQRQDWAGRMGYKWGASKENIKSVLILKGLSCQIIPSCKTAECYQMKWGWIHMSKISFFPEWWSYLRLGCFKISDSVHSTSWTASYFRLCDVSQLCPQWDFIF